MYYLSAWLVVAAFVANCLASSETRGNVWELSGKFEGDILLEREGKNAVLNRALLWPGGVVPYFIDNDDYSEEEKGVIRGALNDIASKTCIQFRAYRIGDQAYVRVGSDRPGCFSAVGRQEGGQTLNLNTRGGCVQHGVVIHEFLHALGLYHQQSATDRDDHVTIHWRNIENGNRHNFRKYNHTIVTDHGVGYDYRSIMHYSAYAFSSNGEMTITPKNPSAEIGQRVTLSRGDVAKLKRMYNCP